MHALLLLCNWAGFFTLALVSWALGDFLAGHLKGPDAILWPLLCWFVSLSCFCLTVWALIDLLMEVAA